MLEVKNLHFSYKDNNVLNSISFSVSEGECVCLLGENGAGKTTLFKCLMGFFNNYKGEIFLDYCDLEKMSIKEVAKKIAYIPQAHESVFNYLVKDVVLMGTSILSEKYRSPSVKEYKIVDEVLKLLDISYLENRGYAEISGGERQLVLIARALAQKSKILIMDEPTSNLDYGNQIRLMQVVKKLSKQGYIVFMSTHNPQHALHYADRVLVLEGGKLIANDKAENAITADLIEKIYDTVVEIKSVDTKWGEISLLATKID